jgi:ABC-type cobalamin/Fe3+-siderophores transport system ATPase subunit
MALHDITMAFQFEKVMLIKNGTIVQSGNPETVLTKNLLREAFDVNIEIRRGETGETYIKYENNTET